MAMPKTRYVDLDGTLAYFDKWKGPTIIGPPVPVMLEKVKKWLAQGDEVVVFTARIVPDGHFTKLEERDAAKKAVEDWCVKFIGQPMKVTGEKGGDAIYDDRAVCIEINLGLTSEEKLLSEIQSFRYVTDRSDTYILDAVIKRLKSRIRCQNS